MKLEDALDQAIDDCENGLWGIHPAWETLLRCADEEWQRREMTWANIVDRAGGNMMEDDE